MRRLSYTLYPCLRKQGSPSCRKRNGAAADAAVANVRTKKERRINSSPAKKHAKPAAKAAKPRTKSAAVAARKKTMTQSLDPLWAAEQLQLLGGRVLIEREPGSERARHNGVIIRPQMSTTHAEDTRYAIGKIVAMGPGMKVGRSPKWKGGPDYRWPMPKVAVGARVIYRTWAVRAEIVRNGKKYDVVSDEVVDVEICKAGESTMAKFRPLFDRALVKRLDSVKKTPGGIIIPDNAQEKPAEGKVLAVGEGRIEVDGTIRPLDFKVGDTVLFGKFSGTEIHVEGEECVILREEDVLGVVVKKPEVSTEGAAAE